MKLRRVATAFVASMLASTGTAHATPVLGPDMSCFAPAGDPPPGSQAWVQRDLHNQYCASLRNRDQLNNPAFGFGNLTQGASLWLDQATLQLGELSRPHGGFTTLIPGSQAADPFRTIARWTEERRGSVVPVKFISTDGAQLRGHIFLPPQTVPKPKNGYPGAVITDGSVQGYENLYFWAAEDLASHGYEVMTYDPQGQGDSDLLPAHCIFPESGGKPACPGVPYQQSYNFYQGAEDSLSFFLSTPSHRFGGSYNPYFAVLDHRRVGIGGHSLGAAAVSVVGQCDRRVKTIVAWDDLEKITPADCKSITIPTTDRTRGALIHTAALALTNDYLFNTQPAATPPDPHSKDAGYQQLVKAHVDSEIVAFRGATHLTYTYIPLVFQASELNERMASYYTLAWFDYKLRGLASGFRRLVARRFDRSADTDSIGAGVWDPAKANPKDPYSGNVPYTIKGIAVKNGVSFYYLSGYRLHKPGAARIVCADMRRDDCRLPKSGTP
jgi:alpha-beta hydrolase superfamily lysophospholipase